MYFLRVLTGVEDRTQKVLQRVVVAQRFITSDIFRYIRAHELSNTWITDGAYFLVRTADRACTACIVAKLNKPGKRQTLQNVWISLNWQFWGKRTYNCVLGNYVAKEMTTVGEFKSLAIRVCFVNAMCPRVTWVTQDNQYQRITL